MWIFFEWGNFLLNSHWLVTIFKVKKVGSNSAFVFKQKSLCIWKICKWKTNFKIKYVNKNFVNFIQISTPTHIKLWSYEMMLNKLSNASGLNQKKNIKRNLSYKKVILELSYECTSASFYGNTRLISINHPKNYLPLINVYWHYNSIIATVATSSPIEQHKKETWTEK